MMGVNAWCSEKGYVNLDEIKISPLDFGFIHSDATYDVLRISDWQVCFYDLHFERFSKNCEFYGFEKPDKLDFLEIINYLIERTDIKEGFLWLCKWKGIPPSGSPRDIFAPDKGVVYIKPYYDLSNNPMRVTIYEDLPRSPGYQDNKNFSWVELTKAQRYAEEKGFDTALLRNTNGYINEGPGFGVCFVDYKGGVITPKTDVLDSVTIKVVEEICDEMNIPFYRKDFYDVDYEECFLCSTSGGLTSVTNINNCNYSTKITEKINERFESKLGKLETNSESWS